MYATIGASLEQSAIAIMGFFLRHVVILLKNAFLQVAEERIQVWVRSGDLKAKENQETWKPLNHDHETSLLA